MEFDSLFHMAHVGLGIVLFALSLISVSIAVISAVNPDADQANKRLVERANRVGLIENTFAVLVILAGLMTVFTGSYSLGELWLWLSLVIMVFYCLMMVFVTKPARLVVADGGSAIKAGMQVLLQVAHVLLILVVYSLMLIKPG